MFLNKHIYGGGSSSSSHKNRILEQINAELNKKQKQKQFTKLSASRLFPNQQHIVPFIEEIDSSAADADSVPSTSAPPHDNNDDIPQSSNHLLDNLIDQSEVDSFKASSDADDDSYADDADNAADNAADAVDFVMETLNEAMNINDYYDHTKSSSSISSINHDTTTKAVDNYKKQNSAQNIRDSSMNNYDSFDDDDSFDDHNSESEDDVTQQQHQNSQQNDVEDIESSDVSERLLIKSSSSSSITKHNDTVALKLKISKELKERIYNMNPSSASYRQTIMMNALVSTCLSGNLDMLDTLLSRGLYCVKPIIKELMVIACGYHDENVSLEMFEMITQAMAACQGSNSASRTAAADHSNMYLYNACYNCRTMCNKTS